MRNVTEHAVHVGAARQPVLAAAYAACLDRIHRIYRIKQKNHSVNSVGNILQRVTSVVRQPQRWLVFELDNRACGLFDAIIPAPHYDLARFHIASACPPRLTRIKIRPTFKSASSVDIKSTFVV